MKTKKDQSEETLSFSLWTVAGALIPKTKDLAHAGVRQVWMHPPSTGGPVLRLRSRRALSPAPLQEHETTPLACHLKTN